MINVKDRVYKALCNACDNVSDAYPTNWANLPSIHYIEEENNVAEWTDNKEQKSYVRYCIHVWSNTSTTSKAMDVDAEMAKLGLERTQCIDIEDPSHLKHKIMRYEAILEESSNGNIFVYHK